MNEIIVKYNITFKVAFKILNKTGQKCLVVSDENNILLGTLTDGDIRKAILKGVDLKSSISNFYKRKPTVVLKDEYDIEKLKKIFIENRFDLVPVIDKKGKIIKIILWDDVFEYENKIKQMNSKVPVVIMAGGKGTRLEPFTKILPKPLVPVNEKTIIEHIIESFSNVGCNDFIISLNYKSKIIKAYFEEMNHDYSLTFFKEKMPLGTAGSLYLMKKKLKKPFFVSNCDIIIKTNYESFYAFHLEGKYDISLIAATKEYIIPYGTCKINEKGHLSNINEKPKYDFLINTGLYILNPDIINLVPKNKFFHITNLIDIAIKNKKKIGVFPIDDDAWIDIGEWAEYKKALLKL